jgi:D-alanyl-D-alanine carboxypeptidase/D-alanyl-D-alanine-endopeptidase (penicillin-binding protein 4)
MKARTDPVGARLLGLALALTLALALLASLAAPVAALASIQTRITAILVNHGLAGPGTAVRVWDADSGRGVYTRNVSSLLAPASNEKLVTSATALVKWGADYAFKTELYLPQTPPDDDGVLRGNVYLKGYGDPSLSTGWFQHNVLHISTANISAFAKTLQDLGVTKIVGKVVGDESYFDTARSVPSWRPGMTEWCGPLSALSLNEGTVEGRRVGDPALFTARRLTDILENNGIEVTGSPAVGKVPRAAMLYFTESSAPLATIIWAMNKPSDNFFAETITKGLGAAFGAGGTTAAGVRVEASFLVSAGVSTSSFRLYDGSGLSYGDRLSTGGVTRLLRTMATIDDYPYFWASLPVAGRDGTLYERMRHTPAAGNLHGKTGTLAIASSLSGYVQTADGHSVIFSILMNRSGLDITAAHRAQDAIGVALAKATL